MIIIEEFKLTSNNWLEVSWVENEKEIHCEFFGDSDEYKTLLLQRCNEFGTKLNQEQLAILVEQKVNRHIPTEEEIVEQARIIEENRILSIKLVAGEIIKSRYTIEWQLNHSRMDESCISEYAWIDRIRQISNEAEINGTNLEDIIWE